MTDKGRQLTAVVELSGGAFTLRADNTALATLEEETGEDFDKVVAELLAKMKIKRVAHVFAVFARRHHPDITDDSALEAISTLEDLGTAKAGIMLALARALPPKQEKTEGEAPNETESRPS